MRSTARRCVAQTAAANAAARPRPSQAAIGDFAPKLAEITDNVLYGDIWERPELSKRDRSLVTVAALIALNRPDQLRSHLALPAQRRLVLGERHRQACERTCRFTVQTFHFLLSVGGVPR